MEFKSKFNVSYIWGTASEIRKSMVGLSNCDNMSDANEPVSTATQNASHFKQHVYHVAGRIFAAGTISVNCGQNSNGYSSC